jgi:hypothetical protein
MGGRFGYLRVLAYACHMPHVFTPAASARSKCRGCGRNIEKGAMRFGECLPNPFGGGEMTLWFHPLCAAYKRPEPLLEALAQATDQAPPDAVTLEDVARRSFEHRRLQRIDGAERSPSGQAKCRFCHEPIPRDTWRIRIQFYEEGRFSSGGYLHLACREGYFETNQVLEQVLRFSASLTDAEREDLTRAARA